MIHLASLRIYPLKSGGALPLERSTLDAHGLTQDRTWAAALPGGRVLTQRDDPRLALIRPELDDRHLRLHAPEMEPLTLPLAPQGEVTDWNLWGETFRGLGTSPAADGWITRFLGTPARLLRHSPASGRWQEGKPYRAPLTFVDGNPFHLVNRASVEAVAGQSGLLVDAGHFRPNLVVEGAPPFDEDFWRVIEIGGVRFDVVESCARCSVVNSTGPDLGRGEPLRSLARLRRRGQAVLFGQNLVLSAGQGGPLVLNVGAGVRVLERASEPNPTY